MTVGTCPHSQKIQIRCNTVSLLTKSIAFKASMSIQANHKTRK